jgi:hypothetical protein
MPMTSRHAQGRGPRQRHTVAALPGLLQGTPLDRTHTIVGLLLTRRGRLLHGASPPQGRGSTSTLLHYGSGLEFGSYGSRSGL